VADTALQPLDASSLPPSILGRRWIFERVGSLLGILPLGVWTTVHLWNNLSAFSGAEAWSAAVTRHQNGAGGYAGAVALLVLLSWHTLWGLKRILRGQPNAQPYVGNARFWLQRLSALGLVLFLGAHIYLAKLQPLIQHGTGEPFDDIAAHMAHHPPTLVVYILGVLGIAYHLGNGLWSFLFSFGGVSSQRGFQVSTWLSALFFAFLLVVGWAAVYALWQAGQPLPIPID
jgi:succinate dehydrogenase / fumarate reductase, cytochrome b subunit